MTKLPPLTPSAMRRAELIARIAESFVIKTKREQKPKMQAYHEIAEEQGISPTTVQNNLKRIGII